MSLIVEDGSKVVGAESYVTVAAADAYWANRNDATWAAASTPAKESALRQATVYLDSVYLWSGSMVSTSQSLAWPRSIPNGLSKDGRAVSSTEISKALKDACCELAKESLSGSLLPSLARGGEVTNKTIGPISITYAPGASAFKKYRLVDLLVRSLVTGGAGISLSDTVNRA